MKPTGTYNKLQAGYVALLSTIIISAVLLVMTIEAGKSGFYTRLMVLDVEAKEQSRTVAVNCGNYAVAKFLADSSWEGDVHRIEDVGECYVYPIVHSLPTADHLTIRTKGKVRDVITNLEMVYFVAKIYQGSEALEPTFLSEEVVTPSLHSVKEIPVMP